jgi:hypothetical protein
MQTSVFLARLIGPVMLVVGLAVFAKQRAFRDMAEEFLASRALLFLSGLLIMPMGLAIVLTHNVWTADWRVLITLFGWLNAIGGAVRLLAPNTVMQTGRAMLRRPYFVPLAAAIWVVLGLLFCLFGFLR